MMPDVGIGTDIEQLRLASDSLLEELLKLGKHYQVCPICLLNTITDAVNEAADRGDIEHGVPDSEDLEVLQ